MFGISSSELFVILVICFLLLGPKKMTELAFEAGKWMGKIKAQLKYLKETQIKHLDDSVFYSPKTEMNKSLEEIKVNLVDKNDVQK